jgi:hypothetical protein
MELARMTLATRQAIGDRVARIQMTMLELAERVLAELAPQPSQPPPIVARRQLANTLGLWRFCARSTCRRSRCCRGEPKECLQCALPLLPAETIEGLLATKKDRRRRPTTHSGVMQARS